MRLTKAQRARLREMFGGRCAYCGCELGSRWHADHVEAVERKSIHVPGKGFVMTGELWKPENDHIGNMMPACVPCNIDKLNSSVEEWRRKLHRGPEVLLRNYATYKHSLRFGLIEVTAKPVVFYFERTAAAIATQQEGQK